MTDGVVRVVAGLACVAVLVAPALLAGYRKAKAFIQSRAVEGGTEKAAAPSLADMRLVLDLAARLKAAGCVDGVALCQQLLDVMLGNAPKAKK
jgi:hypothetical protein